MSLSQLSSRVWQYGKVIAESVPLETLNCLLYTSPSPRDS